jgi:hypothetical protein
MAAKPSAFHADYDRVELPPMRPDRDQWATNPCYLAKEGSKCPKACSWNPETELCV